MRTILPILFAAACGGHTTSLGNESNTGTHPACATGDDCTAKPLASIPFPSHLAVDATGIYVTSTMPDRVSRVDPSTRAITVLADDRTCIGPRGIAIDDAAVYFASAGDGTVLRVGKNGGMPVVLASDQHQPNAVAVDADWVYWTASGDSGGSTSSGLPNGGVWKTRKDGSSKPVQLTKSSQEPWSIAIDADSVWYTELYTAFDIRRIPKDASTAAETIASGIFNVTEIAVDATSLYWVTAATEPPVSGGSGDSVPTESGCAASNCTSDTSVRAIDKTTRSIRTIATHQPASIGIAIDDLNVYWTRIWDNAVLSAPLAGGAPKVLALPTHPTEIAAFGGSVFWLDESDPTIATHVR